MRLTQTVPGPLYMDIIMDFFKDFKLVKKKTVFAITYKNKSFININREVLAELVLSKSTVAFKKELAMKDSTLFERSPLESKALQLEKTYTSAKKKFFRNNKVRNYTPKDPEFKHFIKAVAILKRHGSTNREFIDSQIEGLAFAKTFPKPSQLVTIGAEDRLVKYMHKDIRKNDVENIERIEISHNDRNTPLMENPKFVAKWKKLDKGTATLQDAYYIEDCMIARKGGKVTRKVLNYISKLEEEQS